MFFAEGGGGAGRVAGPAQKPDAMGIEGLPPAVAVRGSWQTMTMTTTTTTTPPHERDKGGMQET